MSARQRRPTRVLDLERLPACAPAGMQATPSAARAFSLRDNLTAYDAAYVALAEALGCQLVTRDARLARSSGDSVQITVR